jgi:hypothetical protein
MVLGLIARGATSWGVASLLVLVAASKSDVPSRDFDFGAAS